MKFFCTTVQRDDHLLSALPNDRIPTPDVSGKVFACMKRTICIAAAAKAVSKPV